MKISYTNNFYTVEILYPIKPTPYQYSGFISYIWSEVDDYNAKFSSTYGRYIPGSYVEEISKNKLLSITGTSAPTVYYFDNSNQRKNIRINASYDSIIVFNSSISEDTFYLYSDDYKINSVILDGSSNTNASASLYLSKIDLFGNTGNNTLVGNSFDNKIDGGKGNDAMFGGKGNDTYTVDSTYDIVVENVNEGIDTIIVNVNLNLYTLPDNVENVVSTSFGVNKLIGNSLNNVIDGAYSYILDGGVGEDTLIGTVGRSNTYIVDNVKDIIIERENKNKNSLDTSIDLVESSIDWILGDYLENLTLTGSSNLNGTGNSLNNKITGNSGNNIIDGKQGSDTMIGGLGNDTYIVDNLNDDVLEYVNGGNDTVISSVNYYLTSKYRYEIENITLTGNSNLNATGNYKSNVLIGNSGNNILNGGCSFKYSGPSSFDQNNIYIYSDRLIGGKGDDTYYVQSDDDVVVELENEGNDTVYSNSGYILPSNVENLTLISYFQNQSSEYYAIGNSLNNVLIGNNCNNVIEGKEGDDILIGNGGNDVLDGGLGRDTFVFDIGSASINKNTYAVNGKTHTDPMFDKITGLEIGTDTIDVCGNTVRKATNIGKLSVAYNSFSYDNVISALNSKFTKDSVFVFTYGKRTFLGVDDGISGYNKDKDCVIEITGYSGNLSNLTVI